VEAERSLVEMQCADHSNFVPAHPKAEVGRGTSQASYSLALCCKGACCESKLFLVQQVLG